MARPSLDLLPLEVLQNISNVLDTCHKLSVANLSLVNKQCRRAASCALFQRLSIHAESPETLASTVERWTSTLQANDGFRHVRQFRAWGDIYADWKRHSHEQEPDADGRVRPPFEYEEVWLPLAKLIEKIPGLKFMRFQCHGTFPVCLFAVLAKTSCRLHFSDFRLGSLTQDLPINASEPLELSAHDLAIVTSPNLYAVKIESSGPSRATPNYTPEAIFEIVARSPGLKEVELIHHRPKASPRAKIKRAFPGLKIDPALEGQKGKLTSLVLRGRASDLGLWDRCTDFNALHTLMLKYVDAGLLEWAATSASFTSLKILEVQIYGGDSQTISNFLASLPLLEDISIRGPITNETIKAILDHHRSTVHALSLPSLSCTIAQLEDFSASLPLLTHLSITIPRTQGDENETMLYTYLGTFPRLHTLHLTLDCATDISHEPVHTGRSPYTRSQQDARTLKRLRRTLINCAIDAALVTQIFQRVAAGSAPLHRLELSIVNAGATVSRGEVHEVQREEYWVYRYFNWRWTCVRGDGGK
jgi:hypothetical protein